MRLCVESMNNWKNWPTKQLHVNHLNYHICQGGENKNRIVCSRPKWVSNSLPFWPAVLANQQSRCCTFDHFGKCYFSTAATVFALFITLLLGRECGLFGLYIAHFAWPFGIDQIHSHTALKVVLRQANIRLTDRFSSIDWLVEHVYNAIIHSTFSDLNVNISYRFLKADFKTL